MYGDIITDDEREGQKGSVGTRQSSSLAENTPLSQYDKLTDLSSQVDELSNQAGCESEERVSLISYTLSIRKPIKLALLISCLY